MAWLKNNSDIDWLDYHCGDDIYYDIPAGATIEVKEEAAVALILKNLGHPTWVVLVDGPEEKKATKTKAPKKAKPSGKKKDTAGDPEKKEEEA